MNRKVMLWIQTCSILFASLLLAACVGVATPLPATPGNLPSPMPDLESTTVEPTTEPHAHAVEDQLCNEFDSIRPLQAASSVQPMPTSTAANAPTTSLSATVTPRPAPLEDRVGFPEDFDTDFKLFLVFDRSDRRLVRAICGNDIAMQRKAGEPFAYGSVLLMISYSAKLDAAGEPVLDENGHYIRENFVAYHVMRKEEGFGEAYGKDRAGEWEFTEYKADGSYSTAPQNSNFCAACHSKQGGELIDYVFRMNMATGGEADVASPPVGENEVSIYLYDFHEPQMTIKAGTTVTWINNDEAEHTVMAAVKDAEGNIIPDPEILFESEVMPSISIKPGASFSFTFDKPGEYLYICTLHKNMTGKIIVSE